MYSVTQRIQNIKQPYGGYLPIKNFEVIKLDSNVELEEGEALSPVLVGLAVDYMTRVMGGTSVKEAFGISLAGAAMIKDSSNADKLAKAITGLDDSSIISACKLVGYDSVFRAGAQAYKDVKLINPSPVDISNIKVMVSRALTFFEQYGPIVCDGITFEGGYTDIVSSGDGDFLTSDTLWDFKVSVNKPTSKHTLQLLMYYIMGMHSIHSKLYENLKYLAVFNPRLNTIYRYPIEKISKDIIDEVSNDVIGYSPNIKCETAENLELSVKDVAFRYGVSENKIRNDCFSLGLPHMKKGNKYAIDEMSLIEWEVQQVFIPGGRNGKQLLPGYLAYIGLLKQQIAEAKQNGDKQKVNELKKLLRIQERRNPNSSVDSKAVGLTFLLVAILLYFIVYYLHL